MKQISIEARDGAIGRDIAQRGLPETGGWLLDEPRAIEAIVEHGDARGRTMGFPTANMHLPEGYSLSFGIYAVRIEILENGTVRARYDGVANFGIRPMYRIRRPLLEAHLFDFDGDLYGLTLHVDFIAFIRPEASFPDLDALITQIKDDARNARALLLRSRFPASDDHE